jgi:PIN domain nuclease of toxin-antitoxin system
MTGNTFDRMIVAMAVQEHLTVLTRDARIPACSGFQPWSAE